MFTHDASIEDALDVIVTNDMKKQSLEAGGTNMVDPACLRYLEIYLTQLKKRMDQEELREMMANGNA